MATIDSLEDWLIKITEWSRRSAEALEKQGTGGGGGGGNSGGGATANSFISGLTTGPQRIIGLFAALEKSLTSFGGTIAKFVGLADPVAVMRFNQAVADLGAVLGKALTPVLERVTQIVRMLADAFVSLSPQAKQLTAGLSLGAGLGSAFAALLTAGKALLALFGGIPLIIGTLVAAFAGIALTMSSGKAIMNAFGAAVKAVGTILEVLASITLPVFEAVLVPILNEVASMAREAAAGLKDLVDSLREAAGVKVSKDGSSVGAAVRNAQIGDVQSYVSRAYTNAYQMGTGDNIPKEQLSELKMIRTILSKLNPANSTDRPTGPLAVGGNVYGGAAGGERGERIARSARIAEAARDPVSALAQGAVKAVVAGLRSLFG